jgi:hypothetical protein
MNVRPCTPPMRRVSRRCPTLRDDEPSVHLVDDSTVYLTSVRDKESREFGFNMGYLAT